MQENNVTKWENGWFIKIKRQKESTEKDDAIKSRRVEGKNIKNQS